MYTCLMVPRVLGQSRSRLIVGPLGEGNRSPIANFAPGFDYTHHAQ